MILVVKLFRCSAFIRHFVVECDNRERERKRDTGSGRGESYVIIATKMCVSISTIILYN